MDAVVCLSPKLTDSGLDAAADAKQLTGRRLLLIGNESERDALFTLQKSTENTEMHALPGEQRAAELLAREEVVTRVTHFVKDAAGQASTAPVCGSIKSNIYHKPDSGWTKKIEPSNLRYYSSEQEAKARGLRASKSEGPEDKPDKTKTTGGDKSGGGGGKRKKP